MATTPTISVLMPAYNCESYVAEAIESVLSQTFTDWELLVADDGSSDGTRQIVDSYTDPRIRRFHSDENQGLVRSWNRLLVQASGEFIAWQDADDLSLPNRLEATLAAFAADRELMLCGCNSFRHYRYSGDIRSTSYPTNHDGITREITSYRRFPFTGPTRVIRREILSLVEGFREFFSGIGSEDIDFVLRVSERYCVGNIPQALYQYRYTRGSSSRRTPSSTDFLRLYSPRIAFFLAEQRRLNNGLDGLMAGGNEEALSDYVAALRTEFEDDVSIIFRRACLNKISNQDYVYALKDAYRAVASRPTVPENYSLFLRLISSVTRSSIRRSKRVLIQSVSSDGTTELLL